MLIGLGSTNTLKHIKIFCLKVIRSVKEGRTKARVKFFWEELIGKVKMVKKLEKENLIPASISSKITFSGSGRSRQSCAGLRSVKRKDKTFRKRLICEVTVLEKENQENLGPVIN
ncbi:hypothetical protein F8M41_010443 [Gigaspora margarita]|uniref:Uncharacterized protein n=1 Tax=Gigaspora margarita TaxID=4874 RepID=A0A8H3X2N6_GIGMA|nr:hypothetical protein F8M41_010443 [Gigaspora margarita]